MSGLANGGDFRQRAPPPIATGSNSNAMDAYYDYRAGREVLNNDPPPPPPSPPPLSPKTPSPREQPPPAADPPSPELIPHNPSTAGDEALLDLEQLEELHTEAERMKALGNKHMAAQEYTRAYNAYSAALQLSPVGPSSHVFLSNRAAALLSLKRYAAAATDARRAVALAPTFGKAHARLGQSLYFLKDYEGAVSAYEEAIKYEPDNKVTWTYLEKAKVKLSRQQDKAARAARGEEISMGGEEETVANTIVNSIATDPNASAAVVTSGFRRSSPAIMAAVGSSQQHPREIRTNGGVPVTALPEEEEEEHDDETDEDPDFDEAVRIQQRANKYLADKQYKRAIEDYSAALFLVPDDPYLSPELHLGRAHALNGSRRHESAKNDAQLALKMRPTSEAYSTLAKSLFYMKDYRGSLDAFESCIELLPEGEQLSLFDNLYYQKADAALQEELERNPEADTRSVSSTIPKLPPPRFVPRERAINSTQNMPPTPKSWPQQSPRSPAALQCGPEREVTFVSESLGIKLNRGSDGIVRVINVVPDSPGSPVIRTGNIHVGDVIREAAGVDIRRPITNIMWGDTVALIKLAPRPISFIVARELSDVPTSVLEERDKAMLDDAKSNVSPAALSAYRGEEKEEEMHEYVIPPSPANGEESVRDSIAAANEKMAEASADVSEEGASAAEGAQNSSDGTVKSESVDIVSPVEEAAQCNGKEEGNLAEKDKTDADKEVSKGVENIAMESSLAVSPGEEPAQGDGRDVDASVEKDADIEAAEGVENFAESRLADDVSSGEKPSQGEGKEVGDSVEKAADMEAIEGVDQIAVKSKLPDNVSLGEGPAKGDGKEEGPSVEKEADTEAAEGLENIAVESKLADNVSPEEEPAQGGRNEEGVSVEKDETDATTESAEHGPPELASASDTMTAGDDAKAQAEVAPIENEKEDWQEIQAEEVQNDTVSFEGKEQPLPQEAENQSIVGEILFPRNSSQPAYDEWTNLRWMSTAGARRLRHVGTVFRLINGRKGLFRSGERYVARKLAVFEEPSLILVLRSPRNKAEVRELLDLPSDVTIGRDGKKNATILNSFMVVESVIDPKACKLRLSPLTTVTSVESATLENSDSRRRTCFELVTPMETVVLSAVSEKYYAKRGEVSFSDGVAFLETSVLEVAVSSELYTAHCPIDEVARSDAGWKHQVILGSLHSYVVSGNQEMLEKALETAMASDRADIANAGAPDENGENPTPRFLRPRVIDAHDESGRTALHYACLRRASSAVTMLVGAGANCSLPTDLGDFPCHLSARNLDEMSLSTMLSATHPVRPDPNVVDALGRTSMYVASVDGQAVGGGYNPVALGHCLLALEAWGGQMLLDDSPKDCTPLRHPVSAVASQWRSGDLAAILPHVSYRYPIQNPGVNDRRIGMSLSASFHYPLHSCLAALGTQLDLVRQGSNLHNFGNEEMLPESKLVSTLRILFEHGFEPNERFEGVEDEFAGAEELAAFAGFSPLQVLAAAAMEANAMTEEPDSESRYDASTMQHIMDVIAGAAEFLVENGARLSLEAPPRSRMTRRRSSLLKKSSKSSSDNDTDVVDRSSLKLESNKALINLLGGEDRLNSAKGRWSELKSVDSSANVAINKAKSKPSPPDSESPGGNDDKSCAICWKTFGTIKNRKHTCKVTNRQVCEDCSSKRIVEEGEEYRLSDGQFLLAKVDAAKQAAEQLQEEREAARIRKARLEKAQGQRRNEQRAQELEDENRDTLFGGVMEKAANYMFGEEGEEDKADSETQLGGITESLGQARNALNERGEKLSSLSDKTAQLKDASSDFAKMAKELKEAQKKRGLFW